MLNSLKHICLLCLTYLCMTPLTAQEAVDSLDTPAKATDKRQHYRDIGFSAADYTLQKRYRPENKTFTAQRFIDNTFISFTGEALQLLPANGKTFSMQYALGLNIGKWINEYNAVRLGASIGTFKKNHENTRLYTLGAEIDHLFNLTSYIDGYRNDRFCELSTVAGAGYRVSRYNGSYKNYFDVHLGMNISMKTGKDIDVFFEPLAYIQGNDIAWTDGMNWKGYNFSPGLKAGLMYVFQPREYQRQKVNYMDETFISFAAGPQIQHYDAVYNKLGLKEAMGYHYMLSFGKTYCDGFGLRTSLVYSYDTWSRNEGNNRDLKTKYAGLRLEAMYNFMSLNRNLRDDFPFAVSLFLGPEAGILKKQEVLGNYRDAYVGVGGGLQVKYTIFNAVSLFLEPRASLILYTDKLNQDSDMNRYVTNTNDLLFNCNLGIETSLNSLHKGLKRVGRAIAVTDSTFRNKPTRDSFVAKRFIDNTFISATGESMQLLPADGSTYSMQYAVGGNIGKWLNRYNAIRLGASVGTFTRNLDHARIYTIGVEADHMFSLTSYFNGYRRDRFCEVSTVEGIGYRFSRFAGSYRDYFNLHLGFNFAMKVGKDMDIFFEPLAYIQGNNMMWTGKDPSGWKDKVDFRDINFAPALKVGLTYAVQPKEHKREPVNYLEDSFISIALGPQFEHTSTVFSNVGLLKSFKPHLMISFGKMYMKGFGFRTSLIHSRDVWNLGKDNQKLNGRYTGLRLEAMYDLMSLNRNLKDDFPFSLSLLAGPEAGIVKKDDVGRNIRDVYVGIAGGMQAKYRFNDYIAMFLEPKISLLTYSESNVSGYGDERRSNLIDGLMNCNLGLEFALGNERPAKRYYNNKGYEGTTVAKTTTTATTAEKSKKGRFIDNTFISVTGEALQFFIDRAGAYSTQYAVGGNIGKWLNEYNAIRLGASIGTFVRNADAHRMYNIGVEADHMYNLTNYIWGYRNDRFCNWSTVGGLGYRLSRHRGSWKDYINIHVGMNFAFQMGRHIDLLIEPLAYFQGEDMIWRNPGESTMKDNIDLSKFIFAPALKVGLTYTTQPKHNQRPAVDYKDLFISVAAGPQFEHSGLVLNSIGMFKSLRPHTMLSIGKVYRDGFGVRTSATYSSDIWKVGKDQQKLKASYFAMRLEGSYDFMTPVKKLKKDYPFSLTILAGPEAGIVKKQDDSRSFRQVYIGVGGGLQAKYRVAKKVSIFLEPRGTLLQYSGSSGKGRRANFRDVLFSCNLGLEFSL